jgi:hypothetical protein
MLQRVFKRLTAVVPVIVAAMVLGCLLLSTNTFAQSLTIGVDAWSPHPTARYLPSYSTPKDWHNSHAFVKADARGAVGSVVLSAAAQWSQVDGARISRLDADWRGQAGGVRAGILPYRVSWCGSERWIAEPDVFCRFAGLREISEGGAGVQAYSSATLGDWLVDAMGGAYRPMVDGQDDKLGPYVPVGPTVDHKKHGISINAVNLASGTQWRFGWLHTNQVQDDASGSKTAYQRQLAYDTYYLAHEAQLGGCMALRTSFAQYVGAQQNKSPYRFDGQSLTLDAACRVGAGVWSVGAGQYTNVTRYQALPGVQTLRVPSAQIAYRHDFAGDIYAIAQYMRTYDDYTLRSGVQTIRAGETFGIRFAKEF